MPRARRGRQGQRENSKNLRSRKRSTTMKIQNSKLQASSSTMARRRCAALSGFDILAASKPAFFLAVIFAGAFVVEAKEPKKTQATAWEHSIVAVEVARKQYDYYQPWSRQMRKLQKVGTVVGERQILTTADQMFDRTLVRLQKGGRGKWTMGEVVWIDYHVNLALVTTSEADFWRDLKPATLGGAMPANAELQVLRWREGNLENRRAEFTQFTVREGQLSPISQVTLETSSEIQGAGWGEPIIADSHVV